MVFLLLLERLLLAMFLLMVVTQVVVPMLLNRPTFPIFRWRRLNNELSELADEEEAVKLEREIEAARKRLQEIKCPTDSKEAQKPV